MEDYPNNLDYKIIEILGQGSFGSAYKVINKNNNYIYAIKRILLKGTNNEEIKAIQNEAKILSSINSEYIVKYYDSFSDNESFNIVMEYCDGLDLRKYIDEHKVTNKLIEKDLVYHIISDICKGLKEIHNKKLIHRDLKPDNLFLTKDLKVKIGDFGIAKQLNNVNEYAKTKAGTMLYMAPEIINGEKYNNKVDIWALGCIIHELCTLKFCFESNSINGLVDKIINSNHEQINIKVYGNDLQNLINSLLNIDYKKRPTVEEILKIINKYFTLTIIEQIEDLFQEDEVVQNYLIERNIEKSIDMMSFTILSRERKFQTIKRETGLFLVIFALGFFTGGLSLIGCLGLGAVAGGTFGFIYHKIFDPNKKYEFIENNSIIFQRIQQKLTEKIKNQLDQKIFKEKIIIYNEQNFEEKIKKIKEKLISQKYISKLRKILAKNFNILLVGCTNAGKSTLINEFLKLDETKRAKESVGGPTDTTDFKQYVGTNNGKQYTLHDTNGITNTGDDSIDKKISNTLMHIKERIESHDPNNLIHCIWYCFQGSNVQPSDKDFIQKLLNIYTTYSIPIIYIHTQTYSKEQSKTCKKGIQRYLTEIYNGNKEKVKEQLSNYINVLARGTNVNKEEGEEDDDDDDEIKPIEPFGLDKLESISQKEIESKGFKSSYYEFIKRDIIPILINGVFNLIFTEYNLKNLTNCATKDLNKYQKTLLNIINNEKLGLSDGVKMNNKKSLENIYSSFKNTRDGIKKELNEMLSMDRLKKDNEEFIKEEYEKKSEEYKKNMNFKKYCSNVENLIYDNISHNSKEIINNILNSGFSFFVIETIKEGINDQFKEKEENILGEIYSELFKAMNNNL